MYIDHFGVLKITSLFLLVIGLMGILLSVLKKAMNENLKRVELEYQKGEAYVVSEEYNNVNLGVGSGFKFGFGFGLGIFVSSILIFIAMTLLFGATVTSIIGSYF